MSTPVSKSTLKVRALDIFRQLEISGEPVVITDHGEPKLEVRPYRAPGREALEVLRGSVLRYDDRTEPVGAEDWDAAS